MSRDLKPVEIYFLDQTHTQVFHEKGLRNLSVTWCVDGKKITEPLISPETKERYPELSFLFDEFKKIYENHKSSDAALSVLDEVERCLRETELAADERPDYAGEIPSSEGNLSVQETVKAWFYGKLDPSFYYSQDNNRLFKEFVEEKIKVREKNRPYERE